MAAPKDTNVHLEAVEVTEYKGRKPKEIGNARLDGTQKRKHSERLLGYCRQWDITSYHNKRKTCTQGIL